MFDLGRTIWRRLWGRPMPPPDFIVTPRGGRRYPVTLDADGRWVLHSAGGQEQINGIAHGMRIAAHWNDCGVEPPP